MEKELLRYLNFDDINEITYENACPKFQTDEIDHEEDEKLFDTFGKERVIKELKEYFQFDFFPRYGGGIGITRLLGALARKQKSFSL